MPSYLHFKKKTLFSGLCFVLSGSSIMEITSDLLAPRFDLQLQSPTYRPRKNFRKKYEHVSRLLKYFLSEANKNTLTLSTPALELSKLGDHFDAAVL